MNQHLIGPFALFMKESPLSRRITAAAGAAVLGLFLVGAAPAQAAPDPSGSSRHHRAVLRDTAAAPALAAASPNFDRIAGANRYATAVAVSEATFPTGTWAGGEPVTDIWVASGTDFPDALATGPIAAGSGPVLLVPATGTVPAAVLNEIDRIATANTSVNSTVVHVIGGTGAVSAAVFNQLAAVAPGISREAGANRYETAALLAVANNDSWIADSGSGVEAVYVANGLGFADALGGGGAAAGNTGALVLTSPTTLPSATQQALTMIDPATVYILGGTGAVSTAVENQIVGLLPGATVTRLGGTNRYDTAVKISQELYAPASEVVLVNGLNYPDALSAAPFAGLLAASTLLTAGPCDTAGTVAEVDRLAAPWVTAIGGTGVVSDNALTLGVC
ncbi:MAG: cell wall-binding repeat-containing protein [Nostocoides sp.]